MNSWSNCTQKQRGSLTRNTASPARPMKHSSMQSRKLLHLTVFLFAIYLILIQEIDAECPF